MLNELKSKFFVKILFNQLDVKAKFKLIKYNKILQNELNINLLDYRRVSKRYLILNTNEKGKEYFGYNDKLSFEGEYKDRKRNGKGKEYNDVGRIIFEGEYKNGKRNGKGKEYNDIRKIIFEGEYKNGKRNGKGKEYDNNSKKLIFEGEYSNGKKWNGKMYNSNKYNHFSYLIFLIILFI